MEEASPTRNPLRGPADVHEIRKPAQGNPEDPQMMGHMLVVEGHHEMTLPLGGPTNVSQPRSGTQGRAVSKPCHG